MDCLEAGSPGDLELLKCLQTMSLPSCGAACYRRVEGVGRFKLRRFVLGAARYCRLTRRRAFVVG